MTRRAQDLLRGTVDLLILKSVADEQRHGFGISRWIRDRTDDALEVEDAALYQALHRLERRGWLGAQWGISENNRRAKFYRLTARGRRELDAEVRVWKRYANAVMKVVKA